MYKLFCDRCGKEIGQENIKIEVNLLEDGSKMYTSRHYCRYCFNTIFETNVEKIRRANEI